MKKSNGVYFPEEVQFNLLSVLLSVYLNLFWALANYSGDNCSETLQMVYTTTISR